MRNVNKVILIGNLTRDPVMKQTQSGQNVVTFGVATNREWMTRDGQKKGLTEFHNIVAWAGIGERSFKYLKKGKLVYVEGYLKTRVFDEPDGKKSYRTEIVIYDLIMLDKRPKEDFADIPSVVEAAAESPEAAAAVGDFSDEDIEASINSLQKTA